MVHGGGSCSGGGGGFSGGGFGGGTYTSNNYYYGNGNRNSEEQCSKCMIGICHCIGVCVCCKGQGYFHTILIFWAWLVLLFLITGLSVGLGRFGPTDIPVSPSDMIRMTRGTDPAFCEGVSVQTTLPVSTYLLPSAPVVLSDRVNYSFNKTAAIREDKYEYWGFYLLAGSEVDIITCSSLYGNLYIIKGNGQFGAWQNDNDNSHNYKTKETIGGCSYPQYNKTQISYHVSKTDEYYFVFANHDFLSLHVDISFNLKRTVYDLGDDKNIVCRNSTSCTVTYLSESDSKEAIVVYVPQSDEFDFDVTTTCSSRVYVFILIFMVIPMTIGSIFTVFMLSRKRRAAAIASTRSVQGREHQAFTAFPPQYQTMHSESEPNRKSTPPSYGCHDDGMATKPPSYEEAIARSDRV